MRDNWNGIRYMGEARTDPRQGVTGPRNTVTVKGEQPPVTRAADLYMGEIVRVLVDGPIYKNTLAIKAHNGRLVSLVNGDEWSSDVPVERLPQGTEITIAVNTFKK